MMRTLESLQADLQAHRRVAPNKEAIAEADAWMLGWAVFSSLVLALLYGQGGYHAAFFPLNSLARDLGDAFWQMVTVLGDGRLVIALALLFARRRPDILWAIMLTALFSFLLTHSLKPWVDALRPPAVLAEGSFFLNGPVHRHGSFPSGHSLTIAAFLGIWFWQIRDWRMRMALVLFSYEIAASRVVVGVHWPVDVAAGVLGGCLASWAGCRLAGYWRAGLSLPGHLISLLICMLLSQSLFYDDGGYRQAALFQQLTALLCYGVLLREYLWPPRRQAIS